MRTTATLVFLPWRLVLNTQQAQRSRALSSCLLIPQKHLSRVKEQRGNVDPPNNFHLSGTLGLLLLPLRVVPVQLVEEDHQGRHQVEMFVHPACFQDALWDVPLIGSALPEQSTTDIMRGCSQCSLVPLQRDHTVSKTLICIRTQLVWVSWYQHAC